MDPAKLEISDLLPADKGAWLPLWDANNDGQLSDEVTEETWARLTTSIFPVHGLKATVEGRMAGFVHYILHPVTGHIHPAAYMQDLFVDPRYRRRGIGQALVEHLTQIGKDEEWARLYWLAEDTNRAAQKLYENLGVKLDFSFYVMPLI